MFCGAKIKLQSRCDFVSAAPTADSRKGCPYGIKLNIREYYVPPMRHRCVEVAAPYKLHAFCRQTISALLHRIHIVTPNTEKLIPKNRQSENCPCHLRDTGSVQLCFELWIMT